MATSIAVSLFLPNTVDFHDEARENAKQPRLEPYGLDRRVSSSVDIRTRQGSASLLNDEMPSLTPALAQAANEDFFTMGPETHKQHLLRLNSPRAMLRSDPHVAWDSPVLNQPRSRAGPLPSASIQDFAKAYDDIMQQERAKRKEDRRVTKPSSASFSHTASSEKEYEDKPWSVEPAIHGNGGLVDAIRDTTDSHDDHTGTTWVGTLGFPTDALSDTVREDIRDKFINDYNSVVTYCNDKDIDGHYTHYCKTILWPIFHYQVPDHPKSKAYADHSWEFYRNVNQAIADQVIASYKRGDTIWVHDYHLLLVPKMIRDKLPDAKIGFFLHTAFPSSEVFRCLSTRKQLLEGMLGANLVAFQTTEYEEHFLQTCARLLSVEATSEGVQIDDHFVNVTCHPIGINPTVFNNARLDDAVQTFIKDILAWYKDKILIVARDKLDRVHGVRQKFLAYERFLRDNPEWREKVVMIQIATSTTEQSELVASVDDIKSRIEAAYSSLSHQPLLLLKQDIGFAQYIALLTAADVAMISALRDGMNLTAHEYIACQDGKGSSKKHGPLILSEFTGSSWVLGADTLKINPWNIAAQAEAIKQALEMKPAEREERWTRLNSIVKRSTGANWVEHLARELDRVYADHSQHASSSVPRLSVSQLSDKYKAAESRLFFIDYEGTLAAHKTASGIPLGSPARIIETLSDLMADGKNIVYIMSSSKLRELENTFRTLPKLGIIAENGCFVREYGTANTEWDTFVDPDEVENWKNQVIGILRYYQERLEGSYIEERDCSLLLRYDKAPDQEAAIRQCGECADQINGSCRGLQITAVPIKQAVLIENPSHSKGTASKHIFAALGKDSQGITNPDFMLVAGDDREDEVVFKWANELRKAGTVKNVFTITVGKRNTVAQATLTQGSTGLLMALQKLNKISAEAMPRNYYNLPRNKTFPA